MGHMLYAYRHLYGKDVLGTPSEGRTNWATSRHFSVITRPQIVLLHCVRSVGRRLGIGSPKTQSLYRFGQPGSMKPIEESRIPMDGRGEEIGRPSTCGKLCSSFSSSAVIPISQGLNADLCKMCQTIQRNLSKGDSASNRRLICVSDDILILRKNTRKRNKTFHSFLQRFIRAGSEKN